jgi:hypothetical protein
MKNSNVEMIENGNARAFINTTRLGNIIISDVFMER